MVATVRISATPAFELIEPKIDESTRLLQDRLNALAPEEVAAVIGAGAVPRTEVVKKLWVYIKKNGLQDAKNRRMINADDKLKPVFGGKAQVSMFDMTKLVSKHLS